jgi:hypothetical protein
MTQDLEEYLEWLADPVAQAEYRQWLVEDEKRRAALPDPFEQETP